jgi:hypothetical protein
MSDDHPTVTVAVDVSTRDAWEQKLNMLNIRRRTWIQLTMRLMRMYPACDARTQPEYCTAKVMRHRCRPASKNTSGRMGDAITVIAKEVARLSPATTDVLADHYSVQLSQR